MRITKPKCAQCAAMITKEKMHVLHAAVWAQRSPKKTQAEPRSIKKISEGLV